MYPPQLWPPNSQNLNPVDYGVWEIMQEKVYKTRMIDLDEMKERLRTECVKLDHAVSLWQSFVSTVVDRSRHLLSQYSPHAVINGIESGKFGGHR